MRLPVNVEFHPEAEGPVSFASRLARAMAFPSVDEFLRACGTSVNAVARGEDNAIQTLSTWSGTPQDSLRRFAVPTSEEAGEWRLGKALFRKEMRVSGGLRFCPRCLVEDIENGRGRPESRPFSRAAWMTRAVFACTCHGELLVEAGEDAPTNDVARLVADGWHLRCQPGKAVDKSELMVDAYVERRIAGPQAASFIDHQEVHVLLVLFQFLGWLLHNRLPSFHFGNIKASDLSERTAGFLVARGGADEIEGMVKEAIKQNRPSAYALAEFFGPMVRHFRRNASAPSYAEVVELLQDVAERHLPVGPGDRFIVPVRKRWMHSIRSASTQYGLDPKRVRSLLVQSGIIAGTETTNRAACVSVKDAHEILMITSDNITTVETAAILGTTDDRVRKMIECRLLPASERGANAERPFYRVSKADLENFRKRLFERTTLSTGTDELVPISTAWKVRSVALTNILGMIIDGRLKRVGRADDSMRLESLMVDLDEILNFQDPEQDCAPTEWDATYLNLTEVEHAISTTTVTVTALIRNGVLPIETRINPRTRRTQAYVHRKSIAAFLDDHRSLHKIASGWRRNIGYMKTDLDRAGVHPIFETTGKIARYYRVEDLEKAGLLPPTS